jgi:hypothetical protein
MEEILNYGLTRSHRTVSSAVFEVAFDPPGQGIDRLEGRMQFAIFLRQ